MRRNTQESNQVSIGTPGFMALGCLRAGSHKLAPLTGAVSKGLSLYDSFTSYLSQADNKNGASLLSAGFVNVTQTNAGGGDRAASGAVGATMWGANADIRLKMEDQKTQ